MDQKFCRALDGMTCLHERNSLSGVQELHNDSVVALLCFAGWECGVRVRICQFVLELGEDHIEENLATYVGWKGPSLFGV